jgi:hypothetical protein
MLIIKTKKMKPKNKKIKQINRTPPLVKHYLMLINKPLNQRQLTLTPQHGLTRQITQEHRGSLDHLQAPL